MKKLVIKLSKEEYRNWYRSWRGDKGQYNAHHALFNMDRLFWGLMYGNMV